MTDSPLTPDAEAYGAATRLLPGTLLREVVIALNAAYATDAGLARLVAERDAAEKERIEYVRMYEGQLESLYEAQAETARLRAVAEGALTDDQVDTFIVTLCDLIAKRVGEPPIIGYTPGEVREALRAALAVPAGPTEGSL